MENHYLLIKREGFATDGRLLSAKDSAISLLQRGIWPLWKNTRNRKAIRPGDCVAIYLAGRGNQTVIAKARVMDVVSWDRKHASRYPLILDGEPLSVLLLGSIDVFHTPKPVKPKLAALSFYSGGTKWGVAFMGGTRALTSSDYRALTQ